MPDSKETTEGPQNGDVVSIDMPAPAGWKKKFTPKRGAPLGGEISFISPTGEEIRSRRRLAAYLKSHPGGPPVSAFDWATGDTPRRSARICERHKEEETPPEEERPKKRSRKSQTPKATKSLPLTENGDAQLEADDKATAPTVETKPPVNGEEHGDEAVAENGPQPEAMEVEKGEEPVQETQPPATEEGEDLTDKEAPAKDVPGVDVPTETENPETKGHEYEAAVTAAAAGETVAVEEKGAVGKVEEPAEKAPEAEPEPSREEHGGEEHRTVKTDDNEVKMADEEEEKTVAVEVAEETNADEKTADEEAEQKSVGAGTKSVETAPRKEDLYGGVVSEIEDQPVVVASAGAAAPRDEVGH